MHNRRLCVLDIEKLNEAANFANFSGPTTIDPIGFQYFGPAFLFFYFGFLVLLANSVPLI